MRKNTEVIQSLENNVMAEGDSLLIHQEEFVSMYPTNEIENFSNSNTPFYPQLVRAMKKNMINSS